MILSIRTNKIYLIIIIKTVSLLGMAVYNDLKMARQNFNSHAQSRR